MQGHLEALGCPDAAAHSDYLHVEGLDGHLCGFEELVGCLEGVEDDGQSEIEHVVQGEYVDAHGNNGIICGNRANSASDGEPVISLLPRRGAGATKRSLQCRC